jgi:hypothetical protein
MFSQPDINNVMIIGIFLCLSSVFIFGYDKSNLSVNLFNVLCKVSQYSIFSLLIKKHSELIYYFLKDRSVNFDDRFQYWLWFIIYKSLASLYRLN